MKRLLATLLLLTPVLAVSAETTADPSAKAKSEEAARQIANARKIERKFDKLKELRDKGWITEDDYQRKKRQFLEQL